MRICPDCKSDRVLEKLVGWYRCNDDQRIEGDLEVVRSRLGDGAPYNCLDCGKDLESLEEVEDLL